MLFVLNQLAAFCIFRSYIVSEKTEAIILRNDILIVSNIIMEGYLNQTTFSYGTLGEMIPNIEKQVRNPQKSVSGNHSF